MSEETFLLEIERIRRETERVKTFRLRPKEGGRVPFRFSPGQHMGVRPHGPAGRGEGEPHPWRHYSLSSSPEATSFVEVTVLRQGEASEHVHRLSPGDLLEVGTPVGNFVLEEPVGYGPVFLAAGIGVAPVRSMIRTCLDKGLGTAVTLLVCFSDPDEAIFLEEFKQWEHREQRFTVWTHFSRGKTHARAQGDRGTIWDPGILAERIEQPRDRTFYLCLPTGLREDTESALAGMGIQPHRIRKEAW